MYIVIACAEFTGLILVIMLVAFIFLTIGKAIR